MVILRASFIRYKAHITKSEHSTYCLSNVAPRSREVLPLRFASLSSLKSCYQIFRHAFSCHVLPDRSPISRMGLLVVLLLSSLSGSRCLAKASDYLIDTWTGDNNLPDSSVTSIAQTSDGYLWIGTYNGLARYDGTRFVVFDPANTPEIKHARISALFTDAHGTLWINTYDNSMTSLREGVFAHEWSNAQVADVFCHSNETYIATLSGGVAARTETSGNKVPWQTIGLARRNDAYTFCQDAEGVIWYCMRDGKLGRIIGTNAAPQSTEKDLGTGFVNYVTTDPQGRVWVGTEKKIGRWDGSRFLDETPTNGEAEVNAKYLFFTATNGYWAFVNGAIRHAVDRQWVKTIDSWPDLVESYGTEIGALEARNGDVWFRQLGHGLYCIGSDGTLSRLTSTNGLPGDRITSFYEDREANIWVGIDRGGLVRLRKNEFQIIGNNGGKKSAVFTVCEDLHSNLWIGTVGDGLLRWKDGREEKTSLLQGANPNSFFSAYPDPQGHLWLSCDREDLYVLDHGQILQNSNKIHGVKSILVDASNRVWIGRRSELACLSNGVATDFGPGNGFERGEVRALAEDQKGAIWIGTGNGIIFKFSQGAFSAFRPTEARQDQAIWSILADDDGTVWAGTFRGGLLRLKDGKFTRFTMADGLPSDIICQILDDGLGRLWFGSHNGIFFIPKKSFDAFERHEIDSLRCTSYGLSDGLPTLECSGGYQPSCWRDHAGKLWFATGKGVVVINPADMRSTPRAPAVLVEDFLLDGKPFGSTTTNRNQSSAAALTSGTAISVAPGRHQFDFQFTAPSFSAPDKVRFRYKLASFENEWVDGGSKRVAHYGPLPPGDYQFQVIASNGDGVWNQQAAIINLQQLPFFWQTWWFGLLVGAGAIAVISAIVRYVATRKLERKLAGLRQQRAIHDERERIAKDIHDDLGTGLTQILLQSSLARREAQGQLQTDLSQISETAHNLVRGMDEIVWAINPENDTLDGLVTYVGKFVQEFLGAAKLRCRLELPAHLSSISVSAETRHHVFLGIKEALNNVVKHARATEVLVELKLHANEFVFLIKDNGAGFTLGTGAAPNQERLSPGHGLGNLEKRMKKLGGSCRITSKPNEGTAIEFSVPANIPNVLNKTS